MHDDLFLDVRLGERNASQSLRTLSISRDMVDFCSNDYLGVMTGHLLNPHLTGEESHGSGGARTLSGNYSLIEEAEKALAAFHRGEAGLIFNSGYCANVGLMSCVAQRGDTILYDKLSHASIRDGIRLSFATAFSFVHNDMEDLEKKLGQSKGNIFVVTESVFSMDGDKCPLAEITGLCAKYRAHLIIDEAHAIGVIGDEGEGWAQHLALEQTTFARIYTFGKAPGCHGAVVIGSERLRSYLVNFARPFIYTTALPEIAVKAVMAAYRLFPTMTGERRKLRELISDFQKATLPFEKLKSDTPIQGVIVPGNKAVVDAAKELQTLNLDVRPIRYPTVPKGKERLRINLHSFNTRAQVDHLIDALTRVKT